MYVAYLYKHRFLIAKKVSVKPKGNMISLDAEFTIDGEPACSYHETEAFVPWESSENNIPPHCTAMYKDSASMDFIIEMASAYKRERPAACSGRCRDSASLEYRMFSDLAWTKYYVDDAKTALKQMSKDKSLHPCCMLFDQSDSRFNNRMPYTIYDDNSDLKKKLERLYDERQAFAAFDNNRNEEILYNVHDKSGELRKNVVCYGMYRTLKRR